MLKAPNSCRDSMNKILSEADLSPIKSQTTKTLNQQSGGSIRRLLSKLRRGAAVLQGKISKDWKNLAMSKYAHF
jgi:hypothetical protein